LTEPFYSRYSQKGKDSLGNPIGMPVPNGTDPASVQTGREQGWKFVQAVPGRADQVAEFNEVQEILQDQIKDLGDYILRDGQTVGVQIRVDKLVTPARAYIEWQNPAVPGRVYALGQFHRLPSQMILSLADGFTGVGLETVAFRIVKRVVTELDEVGLYDQIIGEENYGAPGAYRWVYDIVPVIKTDANRDQYPDSYDIWILQDGEVRISSNDQLSEVDRNLISYTSDLSGNCLVRGMRVRVEDKDINTLRVLVDRGRAYVNGRSVGYNTTTDKTTPKAKTDVTLVAGEPLVLAVSDIPYGTSAAPTLRKAYSLVNSPIKVVSQLTLPVVIKKVGLVGDVFKVNVADPFEVYIPVNSPVYGPRLGIVSVTELGAGSSRTAVTFTSTASGFRSTSALSGKTIEVVWVYNALLNFGTDFNLTDGGKLLDITRESYDYPSSLQLSSNDTASYVYPGVGSTKITDPASLGASTLKVVSTEGLKVGQRLYLGNNRNPSNGTSQQANTSYDELVYINEINDGTTITLKSPLARAHADDSVLYSNKDYIGLNPSVYAGSVNYAWLMDRIDIVYIDQDNNIVVQVGQSNRPAYAPSIPQGVLPIAKLVIPANAEAAGITIEKYDVQRLDQQDLQKLLKRVERAEYNAAIQNLQLLSYTKASATGLNLRGILTDPFVNTDILEITSIRNEGDPLAPYIRDQAGDISVNIDPDSGTLSPALDMFAHTLVADASRSTCFLGSYSITLAHTLTASTAVSNSVYTTTEIIKGSSVPAKPVITVDTAHNTLPVTTTESFDFLNVNTRVVEDVPAALEGGYWRHRQNDVPWLAQKSIYFPLAALNIKGRGIPSGSYTLVVDGYTVLSGSNPLTVSPDSAGNFTASAALPANTISGHNSRTVNLVNAAGAIVASTLIGANISETSFLPLANDSLAASPYVPVAQTFAFNRDTFVRGISVQFQSVGGQADWVEVQLRNADASGQPGDRILARKRLQGNQVSVNAFNNIDFDGVGGTGDPVFCEANVTYAVCFLSSSNAFVLRKAVVGKQTANGTTVGSKPIGSGSVFTSPDGLSWSVQTTSSLVLSLRECQFNADNNLVVFSPVSTADFNVEKFAYLLGRVQQLLPKGTSVKWSYSVDNEVNETIIPVDVDGTLDPEAISKLATPPSDQSLTFRARLFGSTTASPQIGRLNAKLLIFNPKNRGVYKSRQVSGVSTYNSVRVTFQLYTLSGDDSVKLFFAPFGAIDAYAAFTLQGAPKVGDQLKLVIDGSEFLMPAYAPAGAPTLLDFVNTAEQWIESQTTFGLLKRVDLSATSYKFYLYRKNNEAFVSGDVVPTVVKLDNTSTLAVNGAVEYSYKAITGTPVKQVADTFYTEYTYELSVPVEETAHPDYSVGNQPPKSFRLQLELRTGSNPTLYPRIRNLSVIVASV
jgi:hypothetical protein